MLKIVIKVVFLFYFSHISLIAQEDSTSLLDEFNLEQTETGPSYTFASFKTNRIINLHSIENTAPGVMDVKITHRMGLVNQGLYDIFGLDVAQMRTGFDLGLTDRMATGMGRSTNNKIYDVFLKYKVLRQQNNGKMPISLSVVIGSGITALKFSEPNRDNHFSSRIYYFTQILLAKKFSEHLTLQLVPTILHRNLVQTKNEKNDVISFGLGLRHKLTKRLSLNAEYIYVLPDQLQSQYKNCSSIGLDIETGGHVFQIHFTNSDGINEREFITETVSNWKDWGFHFGFNLSRVFTLWNPKS